jgi:hypothetical protein
MGTSQRRLDRIEHAKAKREAKRRQNSTCQALWRNPPPRGTHTQSEIKHLFQAAQPVTDKHPKHPRDPNHLAQVDLASSVKCDTTRQQREERC